MLVAKLGAKCARCAAASVGLALGLGAGIPGAHTAGILDAPCTTLGQKLIVTDYQGAAIASNGRGHGMAAFVRGKDAAAVDTDYLMLVWSKDSGKGDGGISFFNWTSPSTWSATTLRFKLTDAKRWWEGTPIDPYDVLR